MRKENLKQILCFFILLLSVMNWHEKAQSQEQSLAADSDSPADQIIQNRTAESANPAQKIFIVDSPGKKGKEVGDTTLVVNSQLALYAVLYNNGKYKSEATVEWFWADSAATPVSPGDTSIFLGKGSSLIFKAAKSGAGFIFVKGLPSATGDSTGTIRIITLEKLRLTPAHSSTSTITQGQKNLLVSFQAENAGALPSPVQEVQLQFLNADSQNISNHYQVQRIDTTTLIRPGETKQFEFLVDAHSNADTGLTFINVQLMTGSAFYTDIEPRHQWRVQAPPLLNIDMIDALVEEVFPGQEDIFVVMYVANKGGASVINLQASLTFWRNGQNISHDYESMMSATNPQLINGNSVVQIDLIVRVKPTATYGTIIINGKIAGSDANTGIVYSDESADLQASWLVAQTTLAQVGIISTRIICPNRNALGNGEVNVGQHFVVEVVVRNQGTEDVKGIAVRLSTDGQSTFLANATQVISSLSKFQTDTLTYPIDAQATIIPASENFLARIDSATSSSGGTATINAAFDSLAQVAIFYPADLILKLESMFVQVPIGQTVDVTATVSHAPESASFDGTGQLSIMLPQGYQLLSESAIQPFEEAQKLIWKVRAPPLPGGPDTILVYISTVPYDKNNPDQPARVSVGSAFLGVETMDVFIRVADVAIIDPEGARDDTISTDQYFRVRAKIKSQLVENISAKILPSLNFSVEDYFQKPLQADSVTWLLRASHANFSKRAPIILQARGNSDNDTTKVFSQFDSSLSVVIVPRANLKVAAQIIHPPSALQGRITPGLIFQIKGEILNSGEAGVSGNQSLSIDVQNRNSFRVIGDTLLSVEQQPAIWTIQASEQLDVLPKIIKIKIHDIPNDENSSEEAYISNENQIADVQVFTIATNIQLLVRQLPGIGPKAIAPGITAEIMGLEFSNLSNESGFPLHVKALKFDIEENAGKLIAPQSAITGFRIRSNEIVIGETASAIHNPLEISFPNPIALDAQETIRMMIEIDLSESLSQPFQINFKDTSSIVIKSIFPVSIVDELRNPKSLLNLRSYCPVMIENDLKRSFRNYPNPFGSTGREQTHFIYYLAQDCELEIKIYTLIGEVVWRRWYSSNDPQGKKGLHQEHDIVWDGRNTRGNYVLNGVYIARMKTSYGESALTKIAVIK